MYTLWGLERSRRLETGSNIPSGWAEMEVEFLHACDGHSIFGCRPEDPGPDSTDHVRFDPIAERFQNRQTANLAVGVDRDIYHHLSLSPMREHGEIGHRAWRVGGEGDLYVA